jgi:hypothetical protein
VDVVSSNSPFVKPPRTHSLPKKEIKKIRKKNAVPSNAGIE